MNEVFGIFVHRRLSAVPAGEGVNAFPDAVRVDVTLADQTLSGLDHSFDPVQVQLHGGGEVLVLLYGGLHRFYRGGQLHVSEGRLLENEHAGYKQLISRMRSRVSKGG